MTMFAGLRPPACGQIAMRAWLLRGLCVLLDRCSCRSSCLHDDVCGLAPAGLRPDRHGEHGSYGVRRDARVLLL